MRKATASGNKQQGGKTRYFVRWKTQGEEEGDEKL